MDLTPVPTAEGLGRIEVGPGEVADRGHPKAGGSRHLIDAGADGLARAGRRPPTLRNADGAEFDLAAAFDESERSGSCGRSVLVTDEGRSDRDPFAARLAVIRKPSEDAARARRTALRQSRRARHRDGPVSPRAAGHLMPVTSPSRERASPGQLGILHRLRWPIELAFERLKGLPPLDRLPAKGKTSARTWILGSPDRRFRDRRPHPGVPGLFPPERRKAAIPPPSIRRITEALCAAIPGAILGRRCLDALLARTQQVRERLAEPRRRKANHAST